MTEGEDYHNGFENSVHLDVHTKLCDLYGVFKKVSTLEAMYHLCHHLLRHHPLPKRKKNYYIQQLLNQNTKSHTSLKVMIML